jgi:hypothetical protein
MNYKIAKTMLTLCSLYLFAFYIIKFFYPELLIQVIASPTLIKLGEFLNLWQGFSVILNVMGETIVLYLFCCAGKGQIVKEQRHFVYIVIGIILNALVYYFLPELYTHTSIVIMLALSYLCGGKFNYTLFTFIAHGYLSQFLLSIKGFDTVIVNVPQAMLLGSFILGCEIYFWLIILATLFYFKENKNGFNCTPLS